MMRGEPLIENIKSYLAKGQWNTVIAVCNEAIALEPELVELYSLLAKAYSHQGQLTEAIATYEKLLNSSLNQAEIQAELGILYSKQEKLTQATHYYRQALALKPDWAELQYNLAVVLHQLGRWSEAIAAYERALVIKPDYAAVYFNLGVLHDRRGELDIAIANYYQAIELQSDFIRAYSNLGSTFAKQKKYPQAIEILQQGLKLNPTWATLHNNLGQVYWFNQEPEKAISSFEYAIMLEPQMALAYHNLARLWQQQGNYTAARECFEQVIEHSADNVLAYSHFSALLFKQGEIELAIDWWRKSIQLQPEFVKSYCQRALSLEPTNLLAKAKLSCARFLQALEKKLDYEEVSYHLWQTYLYLGDILFEYGGFKQAETYYQQALQLKPQEVELYLRLGNTLAKQKRLDAATTAYRIGLTLQPDHPQICFQLGKLLEQQQNTEQAINYYEVVLKQHLHQTNQWEHLPELFPTAENLSLLPEKAYHHTQDWARDCLLEDFNYVQVSWAATSLPLKVTGSRQPEEIATGTEKNPVNAECGGVNCATCMGQLREYFHPVHLGNNAYKCSFDRSAAIAAPLPFVVTIPQGRTWIAPQKNSWIICNAIAVITADGYLLRDLSRYYPWFLPGCPNLGQSHRHPLFELETLPLVEEIAGKVAILSGLAGHVYYHWMFDILPQIELIRRSGIELETIDWFVVNSIAKPFQRETLEFLGIPEDKIIESDRHSHIQAEEMIVPSFPGYLDWVPPGTIKFLRQTFLTQISLEQSNDPERIYISRSRSANRQIINEDEVIALLSPLGFQTVYLEELSVLEQVVLFANAEIVIAPHGSGLTNLVFCSPNTTVVELFSPGYVRTDYWIISQQLQLQHYYVIGESFDCLPLRQVMYQNSLTEDILVNLESLKTILTAAEIAS